jgi:hypothetical protein
MEDASLAASKQQVGVKVAQKAGPWWFRDPVPPVQMKTGMAQLCNQQTGIFKLKQAGC